LHHEEGDEHDADDGRQDQQEPAKDVSDHSGSGGAFSLALAAKFRSFPPPVPPPPRGSGQACGDPRDLHRALIGQKGDIGVLALYLAVLEQAYSLLAVGEMTESPLDARIKLAVELIRREPDRNFTQKELAEALGLSPSRVLHLFSAELGVPYRRFRLWKLLLHSFELLHSQDNLTYAALDSGFADATHFSHAFRDTFGVNPAPVFRKMERFELIVSD
jgi:AraC-like DNA-binding protein